MSRAPWWLIALAPLLFGLARSSPARADTPPNRWDVARDPRLRARWTLHVKVRELMLLDSRIEQPALHRAALLRAKAMLEEADAGRSPDVRLRFDLGEVYYELDQHERAVLLLRPAVDANPDHPATVDALAVLAYAYAKLDRSTEEIDAYRRFLAKTTSAFGRGTATLNLAEAEMHVGNLDEAVATYREAVQIASTLPSTVSSHETTTLAVWGLAVALDRTGDHAEALKEAALATRLDKDEELIARGKNVFFVPAYERAWYLALAAEVHARAASDPREAVSKWRAAVRSWEDYVQPAEHAADSGKPADRWVAIARSRRDRARASLAAAEKRAAQAPPPKATP